MKILTFVNFFSKFLQKFANSYRFVFKIKKKGWGLRFFFRSVGLRETWISFYSAWSITRSVSLSVSLMFPINVRLSIHWNDWCTRTHCLCVAFPSLLHTKAGLAARVFLMFSMLVPLEPARVSVGCGTEIALVAFLPRMRSLVKFQRWSLTKHSATDITAETF